MGRKTKPEPSDRFEDQAEEARVGIVREFWDFLIHNKKWWLIPIVVVLLAMIVLFALAGPGSVLSPLLYPFF